MSTRGGQPIALDVQSGKRAAYCSSILTFVRGAAVAWLAVCGAAHVSFARQPARGSSVCQCLLAYVGMRLCAWHCRVVGDVCWLLCGTWPGHELMTTDARAHAQITTILLIVIATAYIRHTSDAGCTFESIKQLNVTCLREFWKGNDKLQPLTFSFQIISACAPVVSPHPPRCGCDTHRRGVCSNQHVLVATAGAAAAFTLVPPMLVRWLSYANTRVRGVMTHRSAVPRCRC